MGLREVVVELNWARDEGLIVDYAIGGAIAAFAYIEASHTVDVDVFVTIGEPEGSSLNSLQKVWPALIARGAKQLNGYLEIGGWPVQFLPLGKPLEADALQHARNHDVGEGVVGKLMGPEHLAAIALSLGRAKDYGRIEEFVRRGKLDMKVFLELVDRFGLRERWETFQTRFLANA